MSKYLIFKTQKIIFIILIVALFLSAVVFSLIIDDYYKNISNLKEFLWKDAVDDRLSRTFAVINDFPGSAGEDLIFLKALESEKDLNSFLTIRKMSAELHIMHYDKSCSLFSSDIQRQNLNNDCADLPPAILDATDKAHLLTPDEIAISRLIAYNGQPSLLYSSPADNGDIFILAVNVEYILEEIRRLSRKNESVYLLNNNGEYLANRERGKEKFYFLSSAGNAMMSRAFNFYQDFPEVPTGALQDSDMRVFEASDRFFVFWRIYPTESNFAVYEGSSKVFKNNDQSDYFWTMVAVSQKPERPYMNMQYLYYLMTAVVVMVHFVLGITLYYWFFVIGLPQKNKKIKITQ